MRKRIVRKLKELAKPKELNKQSLSQKAGAIKKDTGISIMGLNSPMGNGAGNS